MPTCHVICAGPASRKAPTIMAGDLVIAVDGGLARCLEMRIHVDLFVGDLDSLPASLHEQVPQDSIILPTEKDDTDTLVACKEGLSRGYRSFELHASLGGDVGHELANIQTLAFLAEYDARGMLLGATQKVLLATPRTSPVRMREPIGTRVSVFAFGGSAHGVYEHGMRWELDDATMTCDMPIGVSNRTTSESFEVGLGDGALVIVVGS